MSSYYERAPCHPCHGPGPGGFDSVVRVPEWDHNRLANRDEANQHPISAISGLQEILDEMQEEIKQLREGSGPEVDPGPGENPGPSEEPKEDELYPVTMEPKVVLTVLMDEGYEVGSTVTPAYKAKLEPGSYTYGPDTGITAVAWEVTDSAGHTTDTAEGSFADITVADKATYSITAAATYGAGAIPVTNLGNKFPAGQILPGKKSAKTELTISGFRRSFFGTTTDKEEITSDVIRGLAGKSDGALQNGSTFDIPVPVGAMRVLIAYPATLQDLKSVKDVNCMSMQIVSAFSQQIVSVEGANGYEAVDYKVYVQNFAVANDTENTYTITI